MEKTCRKCDNFEKYQTVYDYPLYCEIMYFTDNVNQNHCHFCKCHHAGKKEKKMPNMHFCGRFKNI